MDNEVARGKRSADSEVDEGRTFVQPRPFVLEPKVVEVTEVTIEKFKGLGSLERGKLGIKLPNKENFGCTWGGGVFLDDSSRLLFKIDLLQGNFQVVVKVSGAGVKGTKPVKLGHVRSRTITSTTPYDPTLNALKIVVTMTLDVWYPRAILREPTLVGLYNNAISSDVEFRLGNESLFLHKCILSQRCPELYSLLENFHHAVVQVPVGMEDDYTAFMKCVYSGEVPGLQTLEQTEAILRLADKYGFFELKLLAESVLIDSFLSNRNASHMFALANSYTCPQLLQACTSNWTCGGRLCWMAWQGKEKAGYSDHDIIKRMLEKVSGGDHTFRTCRDVLVWFGQEVYKKWRSLAGRKKEYPTLPYCPLRTESIKGFLCQHFINCHSPTLEPLEVLCIDVEEEVDRLSHRDVMKKWVILQMDVRSLRECLEVFDDNLDGSLRMLEERLLGLMLGD